MAVFQARLLKLLPMGFEFGAVVTAIGNIAGAVVGLIIGNLDPFPQLKPLSQVLAELRLGSHGLEACHEGYPDRSLQI